MAEPSAARYRFAYQPILNAAQASVGVELQFAPPEAAASRKEAAFIAADTIIHAFIHSGLDDLLRHRRAWVPASAGLLASGLVDLLPPSRFVLRVAPADPDLDLPRLMQLRLAGFQIAFDGAALPAHPEKAALLAAAQALAFGAGELERPGVRELIAATVGGEVTLLARGVDRPEDFDALRHLGFQLFQGYHFAHRGEASGARADPRKLALLDILARLAADADDRALEEVFRTDPALALHLLRLVNSSAFSVQTRISSIKHAFSVLGRQQLARWLQVLLYALDGAGLPSPLMELALRRGRFIEYALKYLHHRESSQLQDEAYMTGLLSLADVVIGWPIEKVAEKLHLAEAVRGALLHREGTLGRLLALAEALEKADFERVAELAATLRFTEEAVAHTQSVAQAWANAVVAGSGEDQGAKDAGEEQGDQGQ